MGPNPFAAVAEFGSPLAMKIYVILMIAAVIIGTLSSASRTKGTASTSRNGVKDRERPRAARPPAAHIL